MKLYRIALAGVISLAICFAAYGQTGPGTSPLSIPKGGTGAATASAARTSLGVAIGSNVQAWDADLDALAALSGTNTIYYRSAANTWSAVTIGGNLSFSAGTLNVGDAELLALAGLTSAANKVPYFTGSGTASLFDSTSYGRSLVNAADAAALRTLSASVIGTNVQAWDADLDAIAALSASNDDIIQRKAGAWTNRTIAQLATDLSLATTYQPLDSDLTSWALITRASGYDTFAATPSSTNLRSLLTDETGTGAAVFANSPALITPTGIVKGDVGLGNVDNTSDATKNSASATLANKILTDPGLTGITAGSVLFYDGSKVTQNNSNLFWDNTNKRLGIGTGAPSTKLVVSGNSVSPQAPQFGELLEIAGADSASHGVLLDAYAGNNQFVGRRAQGTAASPSALNAANLPLLQFGGSGYGSTGYGTSYRAMIQFRTSAAWTDTDQGAFVAFYTNPIGSAALAAERVRISDTGGVSIGSVNNPGNSVLLLKPQAFASLTACSSTLEGSLAAITDSTTNVWGATITGSGANHVQGYCNGTNWTVAAK